VQLRDVAGAEDALLLADVDALLHHARALRRTERHRLRQRAIDRQVVLRRFYQRHQLRVVGPAPGQLLRLLDRRLQRRIVELVRRGRRRFLAVVDGDQDFMVVLDEVRGDRRVRVARGRPLAAGEAHFHRVGFRHVQDFVGERFDFFA